MNRKIIKAILQKKFNEWVESIKDESIQKLVKKNSIITGGSIVSLLLKEKVNDFDIYFTNFETVETVSNYYVSEFNRLHEGKNTPKPQLIIDESNGTKRIRIKIQSAGIAGENTPDNQYQYFESRPLEEGENYIKETMKGILIESDGLDGTKLDEENTSKESYRPVFLTDNAITLSNQIQLVIRFYGDAKEIHKNYDFVHCTNYWESESGDLTLHQAALESILSKELIYVGSLYPLCSFIRTRKFIKAGWNINAGQMLKICLQISELKLTDIKVLEDQLTGVDTAYFIQVINYLKEKKEKDSDFNIGVPYLISIIDKMF